MIGSRGAVPGVHRWGLYWADLAPVLGSEQGGRRPVLVVSNDGFNRASGLVTVVSLTKWQGKPHRPYPFEVLLPAGVAGNAEASIVLPHQIRTIARQRLGSRLGELTDPLLQEQIENRLLEHLDIEFEAEMFGGEP